jgi:hypothetical protein
MIDNFWGVVLFAIMFAAFFAACALFNPVLLVVCFVWCNAKKFRRQS